MKEDDSEENWTYKDFWKQTKERVLAYKNSPIRKGNRILVMAPLSPYVYAAVTALAVFGAVGCCDIIKSMSKYWGYAPERKNDAA